MKSKDLPLFRNKEAKRVLDESCKQRNVSIDLLQSLLEIQRKYAGRGRSVGITADYESCIADFLDSESERSGAA